MSSSLFFAGYLAFVSPFLAIAAAWVHFCLRRARWRRRKNTRTPSPVFFSSSTALGTILLFAQMLYRPSIAHVVEIREQVDADEDDTGDAESEAGLLNRQLRQIRHGEPINELVLRL